MSRAISQRELRNESAAVMDAVERGETVIITRNGHPVAELRPLRRPVFAATDELKQAFCKLGRIDLAAMRAEADELLGEDQIDG